MRSKCTRILNNKDLVNQIWADYNHSGENMTFLMVKYGLGNNLFYKVIKKIKALKDFEDKEDIEGGEGGEDIEDMSETEFYEDVENFYKCFNCNIDIITWMEEINENNENKELDNKYAELCKELNNKYSELEGRYNELEEKNIELNLYINKITPDYNFLYEFYDKHKNNRTIRMI